MLHYVVNQTVAEVSDVVLLINEHPHVFPLSKPQVQDQQHLVVVRVVLSYVPVVQTEVHHFISTFVTVVVLMIVLAAMVVVALVVVAVAVGPSTTLTAPVGVPSVFRVVVGVAAVLLKIVAFEEKFVVLKVEVACEEHI